MHITLLLDDCAGGTNDTLAHQLGLVDTAPLERSTQAQDHKLVVFVPAENLDTVLKASTVSVVALRLLSQLLRLNCSCK
jgi:hypothetical protein